MTKTDLFIDFDGTIVNSIDAFCSAYNFYFRKHPNFTPAIGSQITQYDFKDICPLLGEKSWYSLNDIFESVMFFTTLKFIDNDIIDILYELNQKYNIIINSIGTPKNLAKKAEWLHNNLPFVKNYILINNDTNIMNKSIINTGEDSIFIDDIPCNLDSVASKRKILFGKKYPWNQDWVGEHCFTWTEVAEKLL